MGELSQAERLHDVPVKEKKIRQDRSQIDADELALHVVGGTGSEQTIANAHWGGTTQKADKAAVT